MLTNCDFEELERRRQDVIDKLRDKVADDIEDYEVLFDVPKVEKRRDMLTEFYVYDSEGRKAQYRKLSEISGVTKALCEEFEDLTKKCRIYISSRLRDKLEGDRRLMEKARQEVEGALSTKAAKQGR
jgi:hypothetical protein